MEQDAAARERLRTLVGNWGREVVRLEAGAGGGRNLTRSFPASTRWTPTPGKDP